MEQLAVSEPASPELHSFGAQLRSFLGLRSTYAELESLKKICPFVVESAEASLAKASYQGVAMVVGVGGRGGREQRYRTL